MRNKLKTITVITFCLTGIWTINSCKKENEAIGTDKELYEMSKTTSGFVWYKNSNALLDKSSGSADADAKGWVWGYINADGTVAESASKKGSSCISCHSQTNNIDYMLMNKYFP